MHDVDRVKLLGRYRTPRFRYGDVVTCEMRSDMKIVGLSNARIPWPKGRTGKRSQALILYGALANAVRRESAVAVAYWFGGGKFTVWRWRKAISAWHPGVRETQSARPTDQMDPGQGSFARQDVRCGARGAVGMLGYDGVLSP
jgi:hypothetical protein